MAKDAANGEAKTSAVKAKDGGRPYVVFSFDGHNYSRVDEVKARGTEQAKAAVFDKSDDESMVLMAVPARYVKLSRYGRSTKPVVKVEHVQENDLRVGGVAPAVAPGA